MKLLFTLSRLEYGVRCLAVRFLGPFPSKTPLTRSATLTQSVDSPNTLLKRKLPKHGSNKTVQHAIRHGDQERNVPIGRRSKYFERATAPTLVGFVTAIFFCGPTLKAMPTAVTHAIRMN
jgi:hypothetical protein